MENQIRPVVRAVIIRGDEILLCQPKGDNFYFFPGGEIKFGEGIEEALRRELKEELDAKLLEAEYIGTVENVFLENKKKEHEINMVFHACVDGGSFFSLESHIVFTLKKIKELDKENILPIGLKLSVMQWLQDKQTFWVPKQ